MSLSICVLVDTGITAQHRCLASNVINTTVQVSVWYVHVDPSLIDPKVG